MNRMYEFEFFELGFLKRLWHNLCDNPVNFHCFIITVILIITLASLCLTKFCVLVSSHLPLNSVLVLILGSLLVLIRICSEMGKAVERT